jgi:hypothetical protein
MTIHACARRRSATLIASATVAATLLLLPSAASAAIVAKVNLRTAAQYAVLGASTVTNTGNSVLNGSLGLSPGTSVTGFPPGLVVPPGTKNITNAAAAAARSDLTAAYLDAHGRPITATTAANLGNAHLGAGVYAGPSHGALGITGPLVLDGAGDASSVFIFQTDSSLTTATGSTVTLVNGAQECNVFWQIGSSATLGTGSVFRGNIMALASISLSGSVTVHGRALARTGAVTLINDLFVRPTCATATPTTTPATTPGGGTAAPGSPAAVPGGGSGVPGTGGGPGIPPVVGPPRTGASPYSTRTSLLPELLFVAMIAAGGVLTLGRRRPRC